jgi:hypothetical protein
MSSIVIAGDTSGSVTLQAPAVAGSSVLSLPAVTDTVAGIAATQTLTNKSIVATQLTGTIAAARLPAGSVVQVVNATSTSYLNTSSTSFVTTGFSASITPQSNTNKIFIVVNAGQMDARGGAGSGVVVTMYKGATDLSGGGGFAICYNGTANQMNFPTAFSLLNSPATTSSTTYTMYIRSYSGTGIYWNSFGNDCSITLMEISA